MMKTFYLQEYLWVADFATQINLDTRSTNCGRISIHCLATLVALYSTLVSHSLGHWAEFKNRVKSKSKLTSDLYRWECVPGSF